MKNNVLLIALGFSILSQTVLAKTYLVGTERIYAPYASTDERGKVSGIDIDILNAIAIDQDIEFDYKILPWSALKNWKEEGLSIIMEGVSRSDLSDFSGITASEYYLESKDCIFSLDKDKLAHWTNGTISTDPADGLKDLFLENQIITNPDQFVAFPGTHFLSLKSLLNGKAEFAAGDCLVLNYLATRGALNRSVFYSQVIDMTDEDKDATQLVIGVDEREQELLRKINAGLENIRKSGELSQIIARWR